MATELETAAPVAPAAPAAPVVPPVEAPAPPVAPVAELPTPSAADSDADYAAAFDALHVDKPAPPAEPVKPVTEPVAPAATAPVVPPVVPPVEAPAPDLAAQFATVQAELAELKKGITAPPAPAATPAPPVVQPTYTADEQTTIAAYLKEWPDVAKGEALMRREEYQQVVGHVFKVLQPQLDQLAQLQVLVREQGGRTLYSDLTTMVPDYDVVRQPTLDWIQTQPAYLKAAYQQVADQGSAQDVADLISRFKKETGYVAPVGTPTPSPTPAPNAAMAAAPAARGAAAKPTVSAAAAAAAAALRPVASGRAEPPQAQDPGDFDAAWKEALTAK